MGFEKVGPNPLAVARLSAWYFYLPCHEIVRTCNKGPDEQRQAEHRHDERLSHEHVSQRTDMQPQQRQLDQYKEEEAQQLRARDVRGRGEAVGHGVELGPDGRYHDGEALAALERLRTEPDARDHAADEDGEVGAAHAERGPRQDGEVDAQHAADVAVEHGWHADEAVPDEDGQDCQARVEAF